MMTTTTMINDDYGHDEFDDDIDIYYDGGCSCK